MRKCAFEIIFDFSENGILIGWPHKDESLDALENKRQSLDLELTQKFEQKIQSLNFRPISVQV